MGTKEPFRKELTRLILRDVVGHKENRDCWKEKRSQRLDASSLRVVWQSGSGSEPKYRHSSAIDRILRFVEKDVAWKRTTLVRADRAELLEWITRRFPREAWWVRERYLKMSRRLGDRMYLPFLRKVAGDPSLREGVSEARQIRYAREAIEAITGGK